jgi:hypothetical protein
VLIASLAQVGMLQRWTWSGADCKPRLPEPPTLRAPIDCTVPTARPTFAATRATASGVRLARRETRGLGDNRRLGVEDFVADRWTPAAEGEVEALLPVFADDGSAGGGGAHCFCEVRASIWVSPGSLPSSRGAAATCASGSGAGLRPRGVDATLLWTRSRTAAFPAERCMWMSPLGSRAPGLPGWVTSPRRPSRSAFRRVRSCSSSGAGIIRSGLYGAVRG